MCFYLTNTTGLRSCFPFRGVLFPLRCGPCGTLFPAAGQRQSSREVPASPVASSRWNNQRFLSERGGSKQFLPGPLECHLFLPGFLSLLAGHMGRGEAGKSTGPPGMGFSCSFLCCSSMSGHDSLLLMKGFLCQVNQAQSCSRTPDSGVLHFGPGKLQLHRGLWNSTVRHQKLLCGGFC